MQIVVFLHYGHRRTLCATEECREGMVPKETKQDVDKQEGEIDGFVEQNNSFVENIWRIDSNILNLQRKEGVENEVNGVNEVSSLTASKLPLELRSSLRRY